ncbi:DUF4407 domain-containing protein [Methylocystis sp. MJC1]|uniref:DUF4407 domain-containing protein n=1 Tax=Methylocystis sp. MJC1 TaxID=2654282 RepID=UPI0013EB3144|nr:DUF4407 domain-containing protein [Methylocystis sp. MJC1]KAF2989435.1 hypothetical protein MJC1_03409 [Methylocystis sp. MJC1]MBU6527974.1 DUF4407 domain-containing protein [Methylocystis sp. MJC1]UZX10895.1 DUF4407 domain-containing protein [Methylocystis sp. MJC1]
MDMPDPHAFKANPFDRLWLKITGVSRDVLQKCPLHDWENVRAIGEIMLCTWIYQAALFSIVAHRLFATPGQIRPELILIAMFFATFIMLIDSYMVMRSGWHLSGISELKRGGGIDISGGTWARIKAGFFLLIRIGLSVALAQLTAVFLSLLIFSSDIDARVGADWRQANAVLVPGAAELVDSEITRATEAVNAQVERVAHLAAQVETLRQSEIDPSAAYTQPAQQEVAQLLAQKAKAEEDLRNAEKFAADELAGIKASPGNSGQAGSGPRRRAAMEQIGNARAHAQETARALEAARARLEAQREKHKTGGETMRQQARDQLPTFEKTLAGENARLVALKEELSRLTQGRGDAIRAAIETAPNHVPLDNGLLAQITVLEHMAQAHSKIAVVIILIDVVSFGFELASVLAKVTSYVPTTYAMLLARDAFVGAVHMADDIEAEVNPPSQDDPAPIDIMAPKFANDNRPLNGQAVGQNPFGDFDDPPPTPPKRPRGRPRKNPPPAAA